MLALGRAGLVVSRTSCSGLKSRYGDAPNETEWRETQGTTIAGMQRKEPFDRPASLGKTWTPLGRFASDRSLECSKLNTGYVPKCRSWSKGGLQQ